jgi:hypothetical protein
VSPSPAVVVPPVIQEPVFYKNPQIVSRRITRRRLSIGIGEKRIPSWNTSGRPRKPKPGLFGFNIQTESLEYWDGSKWLVLPMKKL